MINRTVVIRKKPLNWQPKIKRKIQTNWQPIEALKSHTAGFINPVFIVFACAVFSGLFYVYSINQTAVKGIEIRKVEKEIAEQEKIKESLRIKEAELKSLYRIEEESKSAGMINVSSVKYLEENSSVAYGNDSKGSKN
ncbi:MAG TPA: hypothetical protein P5548_02435 [Candidatus Moranbacteria bacterium]|nr:hypothetical protein [Candidatus Moranbacteria bacterium]HRZ33726.1 hypothetical protein [Candidatus Moranbacteria bacterium]